MHRGLGRDVVIGVNPAMNLRALLGHFASCFWVLCRLLTFIDVGPEDVEPHQLVGVREAPDGNLEL
jgi:hypothetical protein